ncbi:MAG: diguanylate cyclase [Candidatus Aminicenantes bacterium]|nr:diguanylate cyclase [Candidatus Aminicenantes bacterium]
MTVPETKVLVFNKNKTESLLLGKLCQRIGRVNTASEIEDIIFLLKSKTYDIAIIDYSLANYSSIKDLFSKSTSIIITGHKEKKVKEILHSWPRDQYLDYYTPPFQDWEDNGFLRILMTAAKYSQLQSEVAKHRGSNEESQRKLKEILEQIKDINLFIQETVVHELEKRISIQSSYNVLKRERYKVESILKRLYIANDITTLIDIVDDIKDIVQATGISIYIIDENETIGKFLKPLVWDNEVLSHPDFTKFIVHLNSNDFAAAAANDASEISSDAPSLDERFSPRYSSQLEYKLNNLFCTPIMHDQEVIGVLEVYNKLGSADSSSDFSEEDKQILKKLCEHISIAITKLNLIQYDALTGLLRPEPFFEKVILKLKQERNRRKEDSLFSLVMGDVDWFKNFNDKKGHSAGNQLLRKLAHLLKSSMREEDLLCRYGGEEFLFFLTSIKSREEAYIITERLRRKVSEHYFEGQEIQPRQNLTMSFGITNFTKEKFTTLDSITKNALKKIADEADMALAVAKGKRKEIYFQEESSEAKTDKNNISVYSGSSTKKPKSADVIMSHELFAPKKPAEEENFFNEKKDISLNEKNTVRIFSGTDSEEKIRTEIIPHDLISHGHDRRKFRRFQTANTVIYSTNGREKITKAIDLSLGGAKIPTEEHLSDEDIVNLILIIGSKTFKSKGDVVYSVKENALPFYSSGLKFRDFSNQDREMLQEYLNHLCLGEGNLTEQ